jgi:3-hydroxymyristoyl/3-hydroxydecanoyl-(acyl carrier protein) dehydratase
MGFPPSRERRTQTLGKLKILKQTLPADHPAADGHFPGNPVIPGAVLLSEALRMIEAGLGRRLSPYRIRRAKFPHPARPGDELEVSFSEARDAVRGAVRFHCAVRGKAVLVGEVECAAT